jgi:hypothetical protein
MTRVSQFETGPASLFLPPFQEHLVAEGESEQNDQRGFKGRMLARGNDFWMIVSLRSNDTNDSYIFDPAVGLCADRIRMGARPGVSGIPNIAECC